MIRILGTQGHYTNRVIEICRKHGAPPPTFEERQGFLIVTFKAQMVAEGVSGTSRAGAVDQVSAQVTAQVTGQVTGQVTAQVAEFCRESKPAKTIMAELGLKHWKTFQTNYLAPLMAMGVLEWTIPDKPRSRLQRYRTTEAGLAMLGKGRDAKWRQIDKK